MVKATDSPKENTDQPLSSRALLFLHLTNLNSTSKTASQIKLLRRIINESSGGENEDDLDRSLNKIIYSYSYAIANGKILGSSAVTSLNGQNSLAQLKNELFNLAFTGKNYKYFLTFIVAACLMICFIVSSLCLTFYFYKQRQTRDRLRENKKRKSNPAEIYNYATANISKEKTGFNCEFERLDPELEQKANRHSSSTGSTTSSASLTKTTNSTASAHLMSSSSSNTRSHLIASSVSSVSPASTNHSSEANQKFFATNYESLQLNYSSVDSSSNTLDRPGQAVNASAKSSTFIYADEPNYSSVFKVNTF